MLVQELGCNFGTKCEGDSAIIFAPAHCVLKRKLHLEIKSRPLFRLFSSFHTNVRIFTTNKCEKMSIQYMVLGFEPMTLGT